MSGKGDVDVDVAMTMDVHVEMNGKGAVDVDVAMTVEMSGKGCVHVDVPVDHEDVNENENVDVDVGAGRPCVTEEPALWVGRMMAVSMMVCRMWWWTVWGVSCPCMGRDARN